MRYHRIEPGHIVAVGPDGKTVADIERLGPRRWRVAMTGVRASVIRSDPEFASRQEALAWLNEVAFGRHGGD